MFFNLSHSKFYSCSHPIPFHPIAEAVILASSCFVVRIGLYLLISVVCLPHTKVVCLISRLATYPEGALLKLSPCWFSECLSRHLQSHHKCFVYHFVQMCSSLFLSFVFTHGLWNACSFWEIFSILGPAILVLLVFSHFLLLRCFVEYGTRMACENGLAVHTFCLLAVWSWLWIRILVWTSWFIAINVFN